ncbi:putative L-ascorbate peroxidase 6 isoform X1 [Asparagus officinalis]|uniref:putative L-ascorbate peroxidase 6 isoform X1 n=1 Tax=Asparagus officinalis TaxID=4686 RepID=UPI00098E44A2|nr:putative L-ascorbate peroxidase 6 isoform X1 [Asparagus officinalis]XP_020269878.1 putative L-ascorbate peroxidase 6 isoform X1 [Asparagus officinalis]
MGAASELSIVQSEVRNVLSKAKAAGVLRMAFHDAGTFDMDENSGGMNGSIVHELERPENAGLKKPFKVLEKAKREIEKSQQVSWADVIAVAGAEAVSLCGGPSIPVRLGREDARMPDPEGKLPEESLDASGLKRCFLKKGFSTQELVALSGAHTLGSKGFGNPVVFDNAYFKILLEKPWASSGGSKFIQLIKFNFLKTSRVHTLSSWILVLYGEVARRKYLLKTQKSWGKRAQKGFEILLP